MIGPQVYNVKKAGCQVEYPEQVCCGMPKLDGGDLEGARKLAEKNVATLLPAVRGGARIVWGQRHKRDDTPWRVLASKCFYSLTRRFAMPAGSKFTTGSFFLSDRRVIDWDACEARACAIFDALRESVAA